MKRNTDLTQTKQPVCGIFRRLAACRTVSEAHITVMQLSKLTRDQSRVVRGFNVIAGMEGREMLIDNASAHLGHNGGPRLAN